MVLATNSSIVDLRLVSLVTLGPQKDLIPEIPLILIITVTLTSLILSTLTETNSLQEFLRMRRAPKRYCGRQLVDILNLLCEGQYYDPFGSMFKRTAQDQELADNFYPPIPLNYIPYNGISNATFGRGRYKRGIVEECCRKACSPNVLVTYCAK
ncbi:LIRP-like [Uloborus diversus]|uniref:LIRP-like n=1 Tax=Uloborus diversus TaxID=327109 RepID=UPI00240985E3|nr:LIRP-like [Uloborus diversus]